MTLDEYRRECGWSLLEMARQSGVSFNTVKKAMDGGSISAKTASQLADAISKRLGSTIRPTHIDGLNTNF